MNKIEKRKSGNYLQLFATTNTQNPTQKKQKRLLPNTIPIAIAFFALLLVASCSPQSKESYLADYKAFISEVKEGSENLTDQEWLEVDEKHEKFTGKWYDKFEDEYTWKDQIVLTKYKFQYNLLKIRVKSSNYFDEYLREDYKQLKRQIKYYSENEMDEDIEFILEKAREIGDSATKTVENILKDLDIEFSVHKGAK